MKQGLILRNWFLAVATCLIGVGGCHTLNRWTTDYFRTDYDAAERKAREQGRSIFIAYYDGRKDVDRSFHNLLKNGEIRKSFEDMVFCQLYRSHEPDRRYVAQFGVDRAPAMIVVHPDDTCHSLVGSFTLENSTEFLENTKSPGKPVQRNPLVPRQVDYEWRKSWTDAQTEAKRDGRMMLVVAHRTLTSDWRRLQELFDRREVQTRLTSVVQCDFPIWNAVSNCATTPWGHVQLPAIILVDPEGRHRILEMPTSSEAVARFLDGGTLPSEVSANAIATPASVP